MNRCLHDPVKGYYARNIRGIGGSRGDFTTAPQLSKAPAAAIAAWVARALRETGCRDLIEIGPGLGTLAEDVFSGLPLILRLGTRLHLVESSATLAARQKELLGKRASHHTDILDALEACGGNAVIYSNELVDAFPVRLFQKTGDSWQELALGSDESGQTEKLLPPAPLPSSTVFGLEFPSGQRVEIHESYRLWLESWLPSWTNGEMLTIDYGTTVEKLYRRRPRGTLRAYLMHHRLEGEAVYANPGLQDITADVNFSDLMEWSAPWLDHQEITGFDSFIDPFQDATHPFPRESAGYFQVLRQRRMT